MNPITGFWSYSRFDDRAARGRIVQFARDVSTEYRAQCGRDLVLDLGVDVDVVRWGDDWRRTLWERVVSSSFFIPIVTPTYVQRPICRYELDLFTRAARGRGLEGSIRPVRWHPVENFTASHADHIVSRLARLQSADWTTLRHDDGRSPDYSRGVAQMAAALRAVPAVDEEAERDAHEPLEGLAAKVRRCWERVDRERCRAIEGRLPTTQLFEDAWVLLDDADHLCDREAREPGLSHDARSELQKDVQESFLCAARIADRALREEGRFLVLDLPELSLRSVAGEVRDRYEARSAGGEVFVASPVPAADTPHYFPGGALGNRLFPEVWTSHPIWRAAWRHAGGAGGATTGVVIGGLAVEFFDTVLAGRDGLPSSVDWAAELTTDGAVSESLWGHLLDAATDWVPF